MTKDYYKILDVTEFSNIDEIKIAYRKLARKFHPDIAGNSPDIISKFKEIHEAYEILSDKNRKADYDAARKFYSYAKGESSNQNYKTSSSTTQKTTNPQNNKKQTYHDKNSSFNFKWEDLFKFTHSQENKTHYPQKGKDIYSDIEISISEATLGTVKIINMLQTNICTKCNGRKFINGSICSHCKGKGETSDYKRFNIKIPAGIKNLSKIRLAEEGEKGLYGGKNGDLYLTIHIKEFKNFKTDGLNLFKTISIEPYEAVLGAEKQISTPQGNVMLKISPFTKNGQKIRLSNCGLNENEKIGDMIITVEIQINKNLNDEEINLYKKLRELASSKIR